MKKIWLRSDVDVSKEYVLLLCDNGKGDRYYELCQTNQIDEKSQNPDCVFITETVPIDLILSRHVLGIAETVKLTNGDSYYCETHGVWLSKEEAEDWKKAKSSSNVRWIRGHRPRFSPY